MSHFSQESRRFTCFPDPNSQVVMVKLLDTAVLPSPYDLHKQSRNAIKVVLQVWLSP